MVQNYNTNKLFALFNFSTNCQLDFFWWSIFEDLSCIKYKAIIGSLHCAKAGKAAVCHTYFPYECWQNLVALAPIQLPVNVPEGKTWPKCWTPSTHVRHTGDSPTPWLQSDILGCLELSGEWTRGEKILPLCLWFFQTNDSSLIKYQETN